MFICKVCPWWTRQVATGDAYKAVRLGTAHFPHPCQGGRTVGLSAADSGRTVGLSAADSGRTVGHSAADSGRTVAIRPLIRSVEVIATSTFSRLPGDFG